MTDKKEIKKYCSGIDCLTCNEAEPCIYRIANNLQEQLKRKEEECYKYKRTIIEIKDYCNKYPQNSIGFKKYILQKSARWKINNFEKLKEREKEYREKIKQLKEQLKNKEQEYNRLKEDEKSLLNVIDDLQKEKNIWVERYNDLGQDFNQLKLTLDIIEEYCMQCNLRWDFTAQIVLNIIKKTRGDK